MPNYMIRALAAQWAPLIAKEPAPISPAPPHPPKAPEVGATEKVSNLIVAISWAEP